MMKLKLTAQTYREAIEAIPFGKRLPTAIYVHLDGLEELPILLRKIVQSRSFQDESYEWHPGGMRRQADSPR